MAPSNPATVDSSVPPATAPPAAAATVTTTADTLLAALNAGAITKAAYAAQAREAGVAVSVVAAHLRAAPAQDGIAAVAAEKERLERQAAEEAAFVPPSIEAGRSEGSTATGSAAGSSGSAEGPVDVSVGVSDDPIDVALEWLRSRPGRSAKWGARAAERLGADNDFLYDLEFIDSCGIDDEACTHIATCLRANNTLTSIDFGGGSNRIGDVGCAALCDALHTNKSVVLLSLAANQIGDAGVRSLTTLIESSSSPLLELDLNGNPAISDAAKAALRAAWAVGGARDAPRLRL